MASSICALSTPVGGAIAVLRASGPLCAQAARSLCGKDLAASPRVMAHALLRHHDVILDDAMAVFFPGPHSYTGEDLLELSCHGSPKVAQDVLNALLDLGFVPAQPGEFTRRAFLNGKLDLSQAEAVMDLINAQAAQSARAALCQLQGKLKEDIVGLENSLLDLQSAIGAAIDYPEELEEDVTAALPTGLEQAIATVQKLIRQGQSGRLLREGVCVALLGRPNAGKSSLMNALLGRERAIVTSQPGTTRDTLEESLQLQGIPLRLVDTAGLRQTQDEAERLGVSRAWATLEQADIVLLLLDGSVPLTQEDVSLLHQTRGRSRFVLQTKCDLPSCWQLDDLPLEPGEQALPISAPQGLGLDLLQNALVQRCGGAALSSVYVTNARHLSALGQALDCLANAQAALSLSGFDCASTDIQDALRHLGSITGRDVDEAVIDRIFENFCVGK